MAYRALTEEEAKDYALQVKNLFPSNAQLTSREIGDGNLNLVFHIQDQHSGKSIIFKQALPYARVVGESWPLSIDRARIEARALQLQHELCPDHIPAVYHYDAELALTIMEDLSDHIILRKGLIEARTYPYFARHIGLFTARTLFYQSDFFLDPHTKKARVSEFINPDLCKITEDLVFTDPYCDAERNSFNPYITEHVHKLWQDEEIKGHVAQLKHKFLTSTESLIHGDLHTGSIFVTAESTKVIDPEFAYYGPIGFDLGAVFANLVLNFAAQHVRIQDAAERTAYQSYLLNTIQQTWEVFEQEFTRLCVTESKEPSLQQAAYIAHFVQQIKQDALGYAGCKMIRRVVGLAHVADLETIADPEARAVAEQLALFLGRSLIVQRSAWSSTPTFTEHIVATYQRWEEQQHESTTRIRAVE